MFSLGTFVFSSTISPVGEQCEPIFSRSVTVIPLKFLSSTTKADSSLLPPTLV